MAGIVATNTFSTMTTQKRLSTSHCCIRFNTINIVNLWVVNGPLKSTCTSKSQRK